MRKIHSLGLVGAVALVLAAVVAPAANGAVTRVETDQFSGVASAQALDLSLLGRQLTPNQCELTYVNHADAGDALETLRIMDPATCGPELQGNWEDFVAQYRFVLPGIVSEADHPIGRLYVHAGAAFTKEGNQVFQLMLTARGRPFSPDLNGARGFMDSGRKAIVNNFAALTTERMHRIWGRRK